AGSADRIGVELDQPPRSGKNARRTATPVLNILGLSCFYHDAGACLLRDGQLIAAAEEERFSRIKHDATLPTRAADYCLDAAVLTADGVGEWATTTLGTGRGIDLEVTHEIRYPHSLGLLYSAFTAYLGFEVNEGEYKVMGMAAYGRPTCVDKVRQLIHLAEDGSYRLQMRYLGYQHGLRSFDREFVDLFGPARQPGADVEQRHADVAASIQLVTEDAMLGLARRARALSGSDNLCLAGGVAL